MGERLSNLPLEVQQKVMSEYALSVSSIPKTEQEEFFSKLLDKYEKEEK